MIGINRGENYYYCRSNEHFPTFRSPIAFPESTLERFSVSLVTESGAPPACFSWNVRTFANGGRADQLSIFRKFIGKGRKDD
jgi:hypothetical protein